MLSLSVHRRFRLAALALVASFFVLVSKVDAAASRRRPASRSASAAVAAKGGVPPTWRKLTLHDQVAQLVVVPFTGHPLNPKSKQWKELFSLVARQHVGGLILVNVSQGRLVQRADPVEAAKLMNRLQTAARVPLLVGADLERGASMRFDSTTIFPHAMAFAAAGDPAAARNEGEVTAREARAIGVNWVFYPDADVNSNPDNPIINIRSYSENPRQVSEYVDAFLEGAASDPRWRILTTAKHFPGHGDTATDTHLNLATIPADRAHLEQIEFEPFRAAIAHGVDSIMTAHIAVPALGTGDLPATLSPEVLTKLLREEMGFKGIIVTDALEMGGIAKGYTPGDAAVKSIEAGADVLLMPADPIAAIDAVMDAVKRGDISRTRLEESVDRVLAAKAKVGLAARKLVDVASIPGLVNRPASNQQALDVAQEAVTLVKTTAQLVPVQPKGACFAMLRESATTPQGQAMQIELSTRAPGRPALMLDPGMTESDLDRAVAQAGSCDSWYLAAFVSVAGYRGNVSLGGSYPQLISKLVVTAKPVMLIAMGNPYLLRSFADVSGYMTTYSTVQPSEIAAVRALFGESAIQGKLPVTIPNLAKFGDGIALPAAHSPPALAARLSAR